MGAPVSSMANAARHGSLGPALGPADVDDATRWVLLLTRHVGVAHNAQSPWLSAVWHWAVLAHHRAQKSLFNEQGCVQGSVLIDVQQGCV